MMALDPRIAPWLETQMRLGQAERTGRGVIVLTSSGTHGPAIVEASRRGMVTLRSGREVQTLRLDEVERVEWAPAVPPEAAR